VRTDPSAAPGAETEGRAGALNGAARPSLRDRHLCDKPSRPEAATEAAWSRTLFPYALPARFQFTLNQDIFSLRSKPRAVTFCGMRQTDRVAVFGLDADEI
jgi:hypothetical protein